MTISVSRWLTLAAATSFAFSLGCIPKSFTVGGQVSGLEGTLKLSLNGNESLSVSSNAAFAFTSRLDNGASYDVTVADQPASQKCVVTNGSGQIAAANITDVAVTCTTLPPVITHTWPSSVLGGHEVRISGSNLVLASIAFNGAAIEPTLQTDNDLRFVAPENPKGIYTLELENSAGHIERRIPQGKVTTNVASISANGLHNCVVLTNGTVQCWGYNGNGALGNGTTTNSKSPAPVSGINNAIAVSVGGEHSCAVLRGGEVRCWGANGEGQLGNGSTDTFVSLPTTVAGITNAVAVSAGFSQSCAVLSTGSISCWGANYGGQLGNGDTTNSASPVAVIGISDAIAVDAGVGHVCAVTSGGLVKCWGDNDYGQLGNGNNTASSVPVTVNGIGNAVAVGSGTQSSCAVVGTGSVQCWGNNLNGQLGNGSNNNSAIPVTVAGISNAIAISVGSFYHSCALLNTGTLKCWGNNTEGQLGGGSAINSAIPVTVNGISDAKSIDIGGSHTCAVLNSGLAQCWGNNNDDAQLGISQLGNDSVIQSSTPATVSGITDSIAVAAGDHHNCAVLKDGTVQCWGLNNDGQLGNGTQMYATSPVPVAIINNAESIDAGGFYSCANLADRSLKCWGWYGGNGSALRSNTPEAIGGNIYVSVSAGYSHGCALPGNGQVQCWGWNDYGQLGDGSRINHTTPSLVTDIYTAIAVSAGETHSCALLGSGEIKCWGGELANGSASGSEIPVSVPAISNAVEVSAGGFHSCALLNDGTVKCWGYNNQGQLGAGGTANSATPVTVSGISNAVKIKAGSNHSCAVLATGEISCWGDNDRGQLGNGSVADFRSRPVAVTGIANAVSVSASFDHTCATLSSGAIQCWGSNHFGKLTLTSGVEPGLPVYYR